MFRAIHFLCLDFSQRWSRLETSQLNSSVLYFSFSIFVSPIFFFSFLVPFSNYSCFWGFFSEKMAKHEPSSTSQPTHQPEKDVEKGRCETQSETAELESTQSKPKLCCQLLKKIPVVWRWIIAVVLVVLLAIYGIFEHKKTYNTYTAVMPPNNTIPL